MGEANNIILTGTLEWCIPCFSDNPGIRLLGSVIVRGLSVREADSDKLVWRAHVVVSLQNGWSSPKSLGQEPIEPSCWLKSVGQAMGTGT